jgi:hypothetical protein
MTRQEIVSAQNAWGSAVVAIGKAHESGGDFKALAGTLVDELYAYDGPQALFKPTRAAMRQFRTTRDEALSYFIGGVVSEDSGFALRPWSRVRFGETSIVIHEGFALAMGNYYFTETGSERELKAEFSFVYVKDGLGKVKIVLHHSSFPYVP